MEMIKNWKQKLRDPLESTDINWQRHFWPWDGSTHAIQSLLKLESDLNMRMFEITKSLHFRFETFWGVVSFWSFSNAACRVKADASSSDNNTNFTITNWRTGFCDRKIPNHFPAGNWHGIETSQGLRGIGNQIDSSLWQSQTSTGRNRSRGALWHCRQKSAQRIWQTYLGFGNPRCIRCFLLCFFLGGGIC